VQRVEVVRRFSAPPQAVWDVYTDHAGWSEWAGIGKSWLEVAGDPDRKGGGPMKNHLGEVIFEPDGDGTRVVWRCRFDSRIPGLGGLMRRFVTRFFRSALEGLAHRCFPDPAV
jgi:carbon monoxide dehydrogenase subunit G